MEKLFDYKGTYISRDNEEFINLSLPVHDLKSMRMNGLLKVKKDEQGRLDKFTYNNVVKDLDAIDLVMYANHIYNPFAIKEGEILFLPIDTENYKSHSEPELPDGSTISSNKSIEPKRTYAEEVEYLARMGLGVI